MNLSKVVQRKPSSPTSGKKNAVSNVVKRSRIQQIHQRSHSNNKGITVSSSTNYNRKPCHLMTILMIAIGSIVFISILNINRDFSYNNLRSGSFLANEVKNCKALDTFSQERISMIEKLDLSNCNISELPPTIQYATNLRQLDVSNNPDLQTLPLDLGNCINLEILFASSCPGMKRLPLVLGGMVSITRLGWRSGSLVDINYDGLPPNLQHLILTNNNIQSITDQRVFERLVDVRKLMLSHNKISTFGGDEKSLPRLKNLELLRIAGNKLTSIPNELWSLPKLTWLTISGNPVVAKNSVPPKVPWIKINDLKSTGEFLGKGASGEVSSYIWKEQKVAVKTIHGVTSDGNAEDELSVYGAVGSEGISNKVVGCVALLNGERKAVVMQQLPSNFEDLALPPTIIEITVDRWTNWEENITFSNSFVLNLLYDVARALAFLHDNIGVAHGDVYAHNMKVDRETGHVYLLDFGASYFTGVYSKKAQSLEVRAFGILIHEMIEKLDPSEIGLGTQLNVLKHECMGKIPLNRPSFQMLQHRIHSISNLTN